VGRLFDGDAYAVHWMSLPYLVLFTGLLVLFAYVLFTRGDPALRAVIMVVSGVGLIFVGAQGTAMSVAEPRLAGEIYRLAVAPVSFVGPAALALSLAILNRLTHHKALLAVATLSAAVTAVIALTTELVSQGAWMTPIGVYYDLAGPLGPLHVGVMVFWVIVGVAMTARAARQVRVTYRKKQTRRMVAGGVLVVIGSADAVLAQGVGFMPLTWVPLLGVMGVALYAVFGGDLIRRRGRDWSTGWELGVLLVLGVLVFAVFTATSDIRTGGTPVLTIVAIILMLVAAQTIVVAIRRRDSRFTERTNEAQERALDAFVELCSDIQDEDRLADGARVFLKYHLHLSDGRMYCLTDDGMLLVGQPEDAEPRVLAMDARVKAWLVANRVPLLFERMESQRLGGLREPIEDFLQLYEAEVVLPLVDRETLVGLFVTGARTRERALSDEEVVVLQQVQEVATRTLTYMQLYRDAEERVEVAREVEIAAAVQHARVEGKSEQQAAGCLVSSFYLPAGQFGGDWWMHAELPDGRLLVAIGDVTGHGVPAALITATVEGACETATTMLGAGFEVYDMLQLLNRSVLDVGRTRYLMTCFAAVVDREAGKVTFANAGHPFPYLCRKPSNGSGRSELRALVSRGMPLGVEADPVLAVASLDLEPEDMVVFYTDALVESESDEGARYGDRRLQRALRTLAHRDGSRVCEEIMGDARAHYGSHPIREDITLVCVRIGPE